MHTRYISEKIKEIWSDKAKYELWFDIELAVCEAHAKYGDMDEKIPAEIEKCKWMCVGPDNSIEKINEIEKKTKHDVLAFLTHLSQMIGPSAKYIHMGMTSQDLLDTCTAIQIYESIKIVLEDLDLLSKILQRKSEEYKHTVCVGRTHGIHAEPTTFGLKLLGHQQAFSRCWERLKDSINDICRIKCSGAVGTYSVISPVIEEYWWGKFYVAPEDLSTQVVPRDRYAMLMCQLGIIGGCIENLAIEIRHLQRTEVGEVFERFSKGQKGSSAMPHKKNPILTENLTGLARLIKSAVAPSLDNIALWHERDISHSSVERVILPDTFSYVSFALQRLASVIQYMEVDEKRMEKNLNETGGLIYSQQVLLYLINEKGMEREKAYKIVQECAHKDGAFQMNLLYDSILSMEEIGKIFNIKYYTKNIDYIFKNTLS